MRYHGEVVITSGPYSERRGQVSSYKQHDHKEDEYKVIMYEHPYGILTFTEGELMDAREYDAR